MTQLFYLAGSLAAVAALVGLCALLFGRDSMRIDAQSAQDALCSEVPGFRAGAFARAVDERAALIEDARDGAVYLVIARGVGLVTRKLSCGFLRKVSRDGVALDLHLADFTFPKARVAFAEEASASQWEARFARLAA